MHVTGWLHSLNTTGCVSKVRDRHQEWFVLHLVNLLQSSEIHGLMSRKVCSCHAYMDIWPWGIFPFPGKINGIWYNQMAFMSFLEIIWDFPYSSLGDVIKRLQVRNMKKKKWQKAERATGRDPLVLGYTGTLTHSFIHSFIQYMLG